DTRYPPSDNVSTRMRVSGQPSGRSAEGVLRLLPSGPPPPLLRLVVREAWLDREATLNNSRFTTKKLLQRHFRATVFERLLDLLGFFLGDFFLHGFGRPFHEVLGLFETQARQLADDLDDVNLLGRVETLEHGRELGLLGGLFSTRCLTRGGRYHHAAARRFD